MSVLLIKDGKTPGQTQFGLDTFTEHYKCDATADVVLTDSSVPQKGDAHPDYQFMFLTDRHCIETGERASALDLVYTGCLKDDGAESPSPILPPSQTSTSNPIRAQSSTRNGVTATLNFYAKESSLDWITYGGPGSLDTAPDPTGDPTVISMVAQDVAYSPGTAGFDFALAFYFTETSTDILDSQEIVSTKYWRNTERKTLYYGPFLLACESSGGRSICLYEAGQNYSVSDSLTFSYGGGSAAVTVGTVDSAGAITSFSIDSDTIDASIFLVIAASGGTGSGARFQFFGS